MHLKAISRTEYHPERINYGKTYNSVRKAAHGFAGCSKYEHFFKILFIRQLGVHLIFFKSKYLDHIIGRQPLARLYYFR